MKKSILIIILLFMLFCLGNKVLIASDEEVFTVICNPSTNANNSVNIGFHTSRSVTNAYVVYTTSDDVNFLKAMKKVATYEECNVYDGMYSRDKNGNDFYEDVKINRFCVTLTNLLEDTNYIYKIVTNTESVVRSFKTGSTNFSFAWISDFHSYSPLPNRQKSAISMLDSLNEVNNGFDFIFNTGDICSWGGSYSFWKGLYEEDYVKNYMWASTIGNHDYMDRTSTKNTNEFFRCANNYPNNSFDDELGVSYYFIYGNTLFFVLNTETLSNGNNFSECKDWMREVVNNNPSTFIIVSQHYEWFNGSNGASKSTGYVRWNSFFDEIGVDLALAGNNHIYLRTKPIYEGKVSTNPYIGTTYIQAPSSDNERGNSLNELTYNTDKIANRFSEGGKTIGGSLINITDNDITVKLYDRNKHLIDETKILATKDKIDLKGIDKLEILNSFTFSKSNNSNRLEYNTSFSDYILYYDILDESNNVLFSTKEYNDFKDKILYLQDPYIIDGLLRLRVFFKDYSDYYLNIGTTFKDVCIDYMEKVGNYLSIYFKDDDDISYYKACVNGLEYCDADGFILDINFTRDLTLDDYITVIGFDSNNKVICRDTFNILKINDFSLDYKLDNNDLKILSKRIINSSSNNGILDSLYDINNDGIVNIFDLIELSNYVEDSNNE